MVKSSSEPRFEPEPTRTGPKVQFMKDLWTWTEPKVQFQVQGLVIISEPIWTGSNLFEPVQNGTTINHFVTQDLPSLHSGGLGA